MAAEAYTLRLSRDAVLISMSRNANCLAQRGVVNQSTLKGKYACCTEYRNRAEAEVAGSKRVCFENSCIRAGCATLISTSNAAQNRSREPRA